MWTCCKKGVTCRREQHAKNRCLNQEYGEYVVSLATWDISVEMVVGFYIKGLTSALHSCRKLWWKGSISMTRILTFSHITFVKPYPLRLTHLKHFTCDIIPSLCSMSSLVVSGNWACLLSACYSPKSSRTNCHFNLLLRYSARCNKGCENDVIHWDSYGREVASF